MTKLLDDKTLEQVRDALADLKEPVRLIYFGSRQNCDYCGDTRELLEGVVSTSDKLSLDVHDIETDAELAQQYNVDKAPGVVIAVQDGDKTVDHGIRYAGIPAGHEFSALINDLLLVGGRDSRLSDETRSALKNLQQPVHLQVFVTPSCPYCSRAVALAHQMALESPLVQAEMVEATEFPELAERYDVSGVPHTTINDGAGTLIGAAPESHLMAEIMRALSVPVSAN
ncbi:MAG: thioredoxin family protein [Chloroflexi bacterium]|nr:thioredoxin family protein [Chloroflexota bacterium]MCL5276047.1 thioredoxin family protein [Chloroflexota bacterium]